MSVTETAPPAHPGFGGEFRTIPVDPPEGFKLIDFQRFNDWRNFNTHIGPLYFKRGETGTPDAFVMGLRVQSYMCNPAGTIHGGMMMTVADLIGGMGAMTVAGIKGKFTPTVNMSFDFLAPAREGDWVEGRLEVMRQTRSLLFSHIWLSSGDTKILRASCIVKIPSGDSWQMHRKSPADSPPG